jgi:streptogramin lyase
MRFHLRLVGVSCLVLSILSACGGGGGGDGAAAPGTGGSPGSGGTPPPPSPAPPPTTASALEYGLPETEVIYDVFVSESGEPWIVSRTSGTGGTASRKLLARLELVGNEVRLAEQFDGTFPGKDYVRASVTRRFITADRVYWETSGPVASFPPITRIPLGGAPLEVAIQGQPAGVLTQYPNYVTSLLPGPDGNVWFNGSLTDAVGKITREGQWIATYDVKVGVPFGAPIGLTRSSDGNVWMSLTASQQIASITPNGAINYVDVDLKDYQGSVLQVGQLVEASDGNFYFLRDRGVVNACSPRNIGRVTKSGRITMFDAPAAGSFTPAGAALSCTGLVDLVLGPDGGLWFADPSRNSIGRMGLDGRFIEVVMPAIRDGNLKQRNVPTDIWKPLPAKVVVTPDGRLWVLDRMANRILVIQVQ